MAMAIAVALILLTACGGLIYYASAAVNGITEARERQLMDRAIVRNLARLKDDVTSVAVWSDAYDFTARTYDPAWAQVNYGVYFAQYLRHDVSVVLDAHDRPIYAAIAGEKVQPARLAPFIVAIRPLVASARNRANRKIAADPKALGFARVGAAEAAVRVGERVFLASASTVVPEPDYAKPLLAVPDPIVISAKGIDASYLKGLDKDFGLKRARLLPASTLAHPVSILLGADGRALAAIGWEPERPGIGVYRDAMWSIIVLGLVVTGAVALLILRLRRMAADVERARARAEAGDQAKAAFIANMSHEIRTPLNGVLGMAQALDGYDLGPEQRACVKVIRDSGATLLGVLNDVLDLSKIEAGKLEIAAAPFRLDELAEQVCATFSELAAAKDIGLAVRMEGVIAGLWIGDALRIRQVLSNLVSNAVKFTSEGAVTLVVEACSAGVRLSVADTGIGLSEDQLPGLFDKFSQADASTTRRYGGTGLGLSICRELVVLMGGAIEVSSRPGEGSTFSVTLPLRRTAAQPNVHADPADRRASRQALRVLAAEDNPTNQLVLRALLGPLGADLTLTSNGREAVEAFAAAAFDIVLMDVQMPEMNGLDATRAIREIEATRGMSRTPILALTANVLAHQVETYAAAGMDGHLAKPLDAAALYAALTATFSDVTDEPAAA
ncbi:ATP-binding protein [Phenylobacterium sp. VNQ135]|uniref:ATP-binding protein n=1 Tax=Phenylobacterium sp. VNQ135 TaxID=3400922 RepID=UPI003C0149C5